MEKGNNHKRITILFIVDNERYNETNKQKKKKRK